MNAAERGMAAVLVTLLCCPLLSAQENVPIGTFRLHVSYNHIHDIAFDGASRTFAAAAYGIQVFDRIHRETSYYSKANGLSGGRISAIEFDARTRKLIVTHREGHFDVVDDQQRVTKVEPGLNTTLPPSREINDLEIDGSTAFLATAYGVVVFDLDRNQIRGTWRDLGIDGSALSVQHVTLSGDSIFLATTQGILAGNLSDNLHDFRSWKRYVHWPFANHVSALTVWNNVVCAAVDDAGLFKLVNGTWIRVEGIPVETYYSLHAAESLLLTAASGIFQLDHDWAIRRNDLPLISAPVISKVDSEGTTWVGDREAGLFEWHGEQVTALLPACPANEVATSVHYADGKVFTAGGTGVGDNAAAGRKGVVDVFGGGTWKTQTLPVDDIAKVLWITSSATLYAASYTGGVVVRKTGETDRVYNEGNSSLRSPLANGPVTVTAVSSDATGVWMVNYGVQPVLHRYAPDNSWTAYEVALPDARYGQQLALDRGGNIWMSINPTRGGGLVIFDPNTRHSRLLTDVAGQGALPSRSVHSLTVDRDGALWVGTSAGVAYIPNAEATLQLPADAIRPIVENRFALRDEMVTSMAVDAGNRKWFGTQRGVWLFNPTGDEPVHHFTSANSLLPSDNILDIDINHQTGEVFIATASGLVSYRSGATAFQVEGPVRIFPNPVTPAFSGLVGIADTPEDATVKITDASGKLVWETRANGSMATWNLMDGAGRRVPSGIYIVYTISQDGSQREVGKLAVIN